MSSVVIAGDTSGSVTLQAPATAGSVVVTLPGTSGTMAVTGGAPSFSTLTVTGDASISGLTVGKGTGSIPSNTVLGYQATNTNTTGYNNVAIGYQALYTNSTSPENTAVGYQALYAATAGGNTGIGFRSLYTNAGGYQNSAVGDASLYSNSSGVANTALGNNSLYFNTSGGSNTGIGHSALYSTTTANNTTALGYQAGYSNTTGPQNTFIGQASGYNTNNANGYNTFVGRTSGYSNTTGYNNTFIGGDSGYYVTTGTKNTILGMYTGNQGGLDIRTASNKIVISDGDGNPSLYSVDSGQWTINGATGDNASLYLSRGATKRWVMWNNNLNNNIYIQDATTFTNGVTMSTSATSWSSASDSRLKTVTGTYENALADIAQIQPVKFTWKSDSENKPQVGVIAQSVQSVVPEAVESVALNPTDETEYLTVRYTELIPLMIAAIQELNAKVTALEAKLGA